MEHDLLADALSQLPDPKEMSNAEKEREKKQLRDRLKALNAVPRSDWHREFENVVQIDVESWHNGSRISREVSIGEDAPRTDLILVTGDVLPENVKSVFRIYRKTNAIEYKRPAEPAVEQMLWKLAGYGNLLIGTDQGGEYTRDQLTLTLFAYKKNEEQFAALMKQETIKATDQKGIYQVCGMTQLPYQIVIIDELEGKEYAAYRALSDHARPEDVSTILAAMKESSLETRDRYCDILQLIEQHNPGAVKNLIREDNEMDNVFMDLFEPRIKEREEAAVRKAESNLLQNIAERLINSGYDGSAVAVATGYDRSRIDSIARRLNRTVSWG